MNEKRFRVRFEQEDGRGEIVNEKGVELTAREVVDLLNKMSEEMKRFGEHNYKLEQYNLHYLNENTRLKEENEQLRQKLKKYEDKEFEKTQMRGW